MAVCSLPAPELTASVSAAAAAGPTWSAVARAVSVSTLAERGDCYSAARAILWPAGVRAVSVFASVARDNFYPCALYTDTRRTRRLFGSSWCRPDGGRDVLRGTCSAAVPEWRGETTATTVRYSRGDRTRARDERSVRPVGPFGRRRRRIRSWACPDVPKATPGCRLYRFAIAALRTSWPACNWVNATRRRCSPTSSGPPFRARATAAAASYMQMSAAATLIPS